MKTKLIFAAFSLALMCVFSASVSAQSPAPSSGKKPNILVIWGDDIGWNNPSIYHRGDMGYWTPNIDSIGKEGAMFTCWYGQQSCTAGRAAFITGQSPIRTGLTKVGLPGADIGLSAKDPTIAELLKPLGYATGQFGKITWETRMNPSQPRLASMNSSAISTTSTLRRNRRMWITQRTPSLKRS